MANNNGSAFNGLLADTPFLNVLGSGLMLFSRYIPIIAVLFLAENMGRKKKVAVNDGTLSTVNRHDVDDCDFSDRGIKFSTCIGIRSDRRFSYTEIKRRRIK